MIPAASGRAAPVTATTPRHLFRLARAGLVIFAVAFVGTSAPADVVVLQDGSRLLGTVKRWSDDKVILETKFAGTLEIDATMIASIETDERVNVGVDTGDRLVGKVEWRPELEKAVVETELGGVPLDVSRIEAIWPEDGKSPEVLALEAQIEKEREEAKAREAKWTASFELGILYKDGNTELLNVRGGGQVQRKSLKDLLRFYVSADYQEDDKQRTNHEVKGGAYYEYLFTERWFGYGRLDLEYDEFENLDLRLSTAVGAGYYWIKKDEAELKTRAGIGYLHETFRDGRVEDAVQADVGVEARFDITPWLQLTHATTWYPTFDGLDDYRLVSDTAFLIPFGGSDAWKLKLGALYEYDSIPDPGRERLDQTYYANIVLELK